MALDPVVNFFRSTIATLPVASGGTSIVITTGDGAKLPDPAVDGNFNLTIYNEDDPFDAPEIVRVTAIAGDTLTVTRAQEGTSATNKTAGNTWYLELTPTAKTIQDIDTAKLDVAGGTMTGDLTIPDKIIHSGDTDTSIRFPANDTVTVETGGVERLKVSSIVVLSNTTEFRPSALVDSATIDLGLPTRKFKNLYLSNDIFADGDITIGDKIIHSGDTNTAIRFPANDTVSVETAGVERLRVTSAGDVGIGGTPSRKLEIAVTDFNGIAINRNAGASESGLFFKTNTANDVFISGGGSSELFRIFIAGAERMRISNTGNVGIGTTTPATKLDVNGSIRTSTGILFGADTAAANTLDDYEEGTWTPTYEPASGAFDAITYNTQSGFYTKIGNMVSLRFFLRITSLTKGAASGGARVGNLPFAAANTRATAAVWSTSFLVNHPSVCQVSLSEIVLYYRDDADGSSNNTLDVTDLGTGANANSIIVSLTYQAS